MRKKELSKEDKKTIEKLCSIFSEANKQYGQFMPQAYVSIFLNLCIKNVVMFKSNDGNA